MSKLEDTLAFQFRAIGLCPEREFRFHPKRRWRFDFAFPDQKIAVEVEGGLYVNGRHTRGDGYEKDLKKYSEAMYLGWTVYRCSNELIKSGRALQVVEKLLS